MSAGTRQEVMIRSFIEALCLSLESKFKGRPPREAKPKLEALAEIMRSLEALWKAYPIELPKKDAARVIVYLKWFQDQQNSSQDYHSPEAIIGMAMWLCGEMGKRIKNPHKAGLIFAITENIMALYDLFDRRLDRVELLNLGGEFGEKMLRRAI